MVKNWKDFIKEQKTKPYFINMWKNIEKMQSKGKIFPPQEMIFNAFKLTSFQDVKVVILGQDPYHQINQANGLAFSVNSNISLPPSLRNIFQELYSDLGIVRTNGDLSDWAKQGVLLLNTILTVNDSMPLSHENMGWEKFSDEVIMLLDNEIQPIFVLWGKKAQKKMNLVKNSPILKASHPSPFSASVSFFGSKPFSSINKILKSKNQKEIKWNS